MIVQETRTYELDDKIALSVLQLNQKGYITEFCCQGHPDGAYVLFDRCTSLILDNLLRNNIKKYGKILYNCPNNWIIDRDENDNYIYYKSFVIRRRFTDEEFLTNTDEQLTDMAMKELSEWVNSLPQRDNDNDYKILKM